MFHRKLALYSVSRRWRGRGYCTKKDLRFAPKEFGCGIPPWDPTPPPEPPRVQPLPPQLIRPPCYPGQTRGGHQTCLQGEEGVYCTPCRLKYKYPSFSENIDFVPLDNHPLCWWRSPETCLLTEDADDLLKNFTRTQLCPWEVNG